MDNHHLMIAEWDKIHESQNNIRLLHKIEEDVTYLIHKKGGNKEVAIVKVIYGSPLQIAGVLLASSNKDQLMFDPYDYSLWMKFIEDVEPFNVEDAPMCINWEYITPEFKKMYFNQGD